MFSMSRFSDGWPIIFPTNGHFFAQYQLSKALSAQMEKRAEGDNTVKGHAQAEEQGDAVEGGDPDEIKNIK